MNSLRKNTIYSKIHRFLNSEVFFAWGGENAVTRAQWPASLGYVGLGRMLLPYPLKTPPPSSSALRRDNPGKTCRHSSGLSFHAPLYLLLRAVTALVIFSASSEYWADLLLWFFVVLYLCPVLAAHLYEYLADKGLNFGNTRKAVISVPFLFLFTILWNTAIYYFFISVTYFC